MKTLFNLLTCLLLLLLCGDVWGYELSEVPLTAKIIEAVRSDNLAAAKLSTDALLADANTAIDPCNARSVYLLAWEYHAKDLKSDADKVYSFIESAYPGTKCAKLAKARQLVIKVDIAVANKDPNNVKKYFSEFQAIDPNIYWPDEGAGLMFWMSQSCAKAGLSGESNQIFEAMLIAYPNSTQAEEAKLKYIPPSPRSLTDSQVLSVFESINIAAEPASDCSRSAYNYLLLYCEEAASRKGEAKTACYRISQRLFEKYIAARYPPDEITDQPYHIYAISCYRLGDFDKAIDAYTNLYLANPDLLDVGLFSIALCHEKKADGEAIEAYKTVVRECPDTALGYQANVKLNELGAN